MINSICVFCGAKAGYNDNFTKTAAELGEIIANNNIKLIYGGGNIGIMNIIAESILNAGGQVIGVITHKLMKYEVGHKGLTKMYVVNSLHQRKELEIKLSDAFIILPGGFGTMDEFFEVLVHKQLGIINKPIGILNIDGFYDPLINLIEHFVVNGFVSQKQKQLILVENQPKALFEKIIRYRSFNVPIL